MINYEKLKVEHASISEQLSRQEVVDDRLKYQTLAKRFSFLEKVLVLVNGKEKLLEEKAGLNAILASSAEDDNLKTMAKEEFKGIEERLASLDEDIEDMFIIELESDRDVIIEIRAGVGGEEAALFAGDLFKMYLRYIEKNNWKVEVLSSHSTDIKGLKEAIFSVKGKGAFTHLKFESGVHRVQRVPDTEASGRIHTSTVTVAVLLEPQEVELEIKPDDLRVDTFRASGAGGQHVNKTDSAVRITHLPTQTIVACQEDRSQIKNRAKAMRVLKFKILEKMERQLAEKVTNQRRVQVGTGERSEKIRTYNFPERRVTDHRINFTIYRLEAVLEGELEGFIKALLSEEKRKIFEAQGLT